METKFRFIGMSSFFSPFSTFTAELEPEIRKSKETCVLTKLLAFLLISP